MSKRQHYKGRKRLRCWHRTRRQDGLYKRAIRLLEGAERGA